jgi:hypothetical protein
MNRLLVLVAAILAIPTMSAAQPSWSSAIDEAHDTARVHLGPFYAKPALQLKEIGIDGNVFNADGDQQRSDFTFTVLPKADVWVPVARRALLKATAGTDLVWYAHYDAERSVDPQVSARGEVYLQRLMLFAEGGYLNSRQRPNQEIDIRSRHFEDNAALGAAFRLTPEFSVEVAGRQIRTRFDADAEFDNTSLQRTLNRETRGLELRTHYRLTPLTSLGVRYDRFQDTFTFSPNRDSESYRVMPGVEFKPRALVNGSAYVGYRQFTPSTRGTLPEFSGLVAQLGLSYTLLGSTTFGVSYNRDLTYSYDELEPFFVDDSIGASLRRAIGRRFDALVSADRHAYAYRESLTNELVVAGDPRIDVTWNYAASLGYRLGKEGRLGFGVSYWQRDSTTKRFRNYDNLRVGSSVSFGF